MSTPNEQAVRQRAIEFLNGQHIQEQGFYTAIRSYIAEIPVDRTGIKHCPSCENIVCGICGECHELDKEFVFLAPHCPVATPTRMQSNPTCVAWSWAYIFLRNADKVINNA